ncbi:MAG: hypothetical protein JEZ06_23700 [Anaerolineaceae bacterium]|nr:hypothetical protein [Anaerolineaceae bacterium]
MDLEFRKREIIETAQDIWGVPLIPSGCERCQQAYLVKENTKIICPNCAQTFLQPQPVRLRSEPPEKVIPFKVNRIALDSITKNFVKGIWFRSSDFTAEHLSSRITPVYLPMWLVDGKVTGNWSAETGFNYQVKSSREKYAGGNWQSEDVLETRIRWEPRAGQLSREYENLVVPAMEDHQRMIKLVGRYELNQAVSYLKEETLEFSYRIPDLDYENAWPQVKTEFDKSAAVDCQVAASADHIQSFTIDAQYEQLNWSQLLLPVYSTYYTTDSGKKEIVLINGQTGQAGGLKIASQKKGWLWASILFGISLLFFCLGLMAIGLTAWIDLTSVVSAILIVIALAFGLSSIVPAVWPWQWNRKQKDHRITSQ